MNLENLPQTKKALSELDNMLNRLHQSLQNKKNAIGQQRQSYKHNMTQKNEQIDVLKETVANTLNKVINATQKIDMVLKEDGSSNNNN